MMRRALACLLLLSACSGDYVPNWFEGNAPEIKRTPGERIDVVFTNSQLTPESAVADVPIELPEQANLPHWYSRNQAMTTTPHIGVTGIESEEKVRIGDGNSFSRPIVASPIIADGIVVAMDAAGIISAHNESHISQVQWVNRDGLASGSRDVLGGGLTYENGTVYASTGTGGLRAIELKTGKTIWKTQIGAPLRGSPAIGNGVVVVLTADNQTIAVDATTGSTRWTHRGIRELAGYFSTTSPVINEGIVIAAYSSGEIFALRAETGNMLWSDTLASNIKTKASAVFSGIDADPIVQNGVVIVVSAAGELQVSSLANGRPLWQKRIGAHMTPWSAGNALFILSDTHDVAALFKQGGQIRWAKSLAVRDRRDASKDVTPALYGPILAGNAVLILDSNGILSAYKPQDGEMIATYELAPESVTAPIVSNGALYYVTRDARLHRYH